MVAAYGSECVRPAGPTSSRKATSAPAQATASPTAPAVQNFGFGVEYMEASLAEAYAPLGARWVRSTTGHFSWGEVETQPPTENGQHRYQWQHADRLVTEWQAAGFDIQVYTNANSQWASSQPKHHFPDAQYLDDWEEYVYQLVERYDGDGDRDMPGLKRPILDYTIVEEWTSYFPGTVEEYLELLRRAYPAIKRANPSARARLVDLMMFDVFEGNPSLDEVARRLPRDHPLRHPMWEVQEMLRHPDLFDIVEIHSLGDYSELYATAAWLRAEMEKNGYQKPLWIGDALAVSSLIYPVSPTAILPSARDKDFGTSVCIDPDDALRVVHWLDAVREAKANQHEVALRWWRALQARELVKKTVVAIDAGFSGINHAWLIDDIPVLQQPRVTGSWGFQAFADAEYQLTAGHWRIKALRPVYHTYHLLIDKIGNCTEVTRLELGPQVYAYRFTVQERSVYVLWYEPGQIYFPDEKAPDPVEVQLPLSAEKAAITHIVTEIGVAEPQIEEVTAKEGTLALQVGIAPVFVEPLD